MRLGTTKGDIVAKGCFDDEKNFNSQTVGRKKIMEVEMTSFA